MHKIPSGFYSSEFFAAMLMILVMTAFLAGGFYLCLRDKSTSAYFSGGAVIGTVAGVVVHFYGSHRTELKAQGCKHEEPHS